MVVNVTLDYFDGSQSKAKTCEAESIPLRELMFQLMSSEVCGVTITKVSGIIKAVDRLG